MDLHKAPIVKAPKKRFQGASLYGHYKALNFLDQGLKIKGRALCILSY